MRMQESCQDNADVGSLTIHQFENSLDGMSSDRICTAFAGMLPFILQRGRIVVTNPRDSTLSGLLPQLT